MWLWTLVSGSSAKPPPRGWVSQSTRLSLGQRSELLCGQRLHRLDFVVDALLLRAPARETRSSAERVHNGRDGASRGRRSKRRAPSLAAAHATRRHPQRFRARQRTAAAASSEHRRVPRTHAARSGSRASVRQRRASHCRVRRSGARVAPRASLTAPGERARAAWRSAEQSSGASVKLTSRLYRRSDDATPACCACEARPSRSQHVTRPPRPCGWLPVDRRGVQHGPRACACAATGASCCVPSVAQPLTRAAGAAHRAGGRACCRAAGCRVCVRGEGALSCTRARRAPTGGNVACAPCADAARALSTRGRSACALDSRVRRAPSPGAARALALTPCACGECAGGTRGRRGGAMQGAPDAASVGEPRAGAALRRARGRGASWLRLSAQFVLTFMRCCSCRTLGQRLLALPRSASV